MYRQQVSAAKASSATRLIGDASQPAAGVLAA
jgi:hypothetical protein